jgi:hypothetical protein
VEWNDGNGDAPIEIECDRDLWVLGVLSRYSRLTGREEAHGGARDAERMEWSGMDAPVELDAIEFFGSWGVWSQHAARRLTDGLTDGRTDGREEAHGGARHDAERMESGMDGMEAPVEKPFPSDRVKRIPERVRWSWRGLGID